MSFGRHSTRDQSAARLALWATVVLALVTVVAVGPVAPDSADGNYTVNPEDQPKDRRPAENDTTWNHLVAPNTSLDVESVEFRSNAGSFADCIAPTIGTLGVDRGDDSNGTTIDESLQNRTDRVVNGPNRLQFEFQGGNDSSFPTLTSSDQLVIVPVECFQNPDEAGWYTFNVWLNGTEVDGNASVALDFSEWVAVCNCESQDDSREALGPPVGTPTSSPTPMPTQTETPQPTDTSEHTPTAATPTNPTPTISTVTPTTDSTSESSTVTDGTVSPTAPRTPTDGDGSGFGGLLAVAAVVGVAVALRRARR